MTHDSPTAPDWPASTNPRRHRYPSDLKDGQWATIAPHIARTTEVGRPSRYDLRDVVDAINYRWQTGCVWRMLPHDFPPWATVYSHFRAWQRRGLLSRLREILLRPCREPLPMRESVARTPAAASCAPECDMTPTGGESAPSELDQFPARPVAA
jgi:transposase